MAASGVGNETGPQFDHGNPIDLFIMKYLILVTMDRNSDVGRQYEAGTLSGPELQTKLGQLLAKLKSTGKLLDVSVLAPQSKSARVCGAGNKVSVTDGPFIESKEIIGGYIMIEAASQRDAIEIGRSLMKVHVEVLGPTYKGEMEVRQLSDQPPGCAPE
jgi:hypothetical protein